MLKHTIDRFGCEEGEAIYIYFTLGLPVSDIAKLTKLSPNHVAGTLMLYSERLAEKLNIFKRVIPYNENDMLQVSEMLALRNCLESRF